MSILKAEIKRGALLDVGKKLNEQRAHCERRAEQLTGGKLALSDMARLLPSVLQGVDDALDRGEVPDLPTAKLVKAWVSKAILAVENRSLALQNEEIAERGRLDQAIKAQGVVEAAFNAEGNKIDAIREAEVEGEINDDEFTGSPPNRPPGVRPGETEVQRLKAEAKVKKTEAKKPKSKAKSKGKKKKAE